MKNCAYLDKDLDFALETVVPSGIARLVNHLCAREGFLVSHGEAQLVE